MDKILSARVDDLVLNKITFLAQKLHMSKKKVIESAVQMYAREMEAAGGMDVWAQTCGTWKRNETPELTVRRAKSAFKKSMGRYQS